MEEEVPAAEEEVPGDVPTVVEADTFKSFGKKRMKTGQNEKIIKKVLAFYGYAVYNRSRCDVDSVEA